MAHLLGGESLHVEFPTKVVLDSVTVGVEEGDRIGIVGRNGDGKSTLLNLLGGRLTPDAGRVTVRRDVRVGMLDQSGEIDPGLTVARAVVGDLAEHEWASDARMRDVVTGLVADLPWDARVGTLSGGQRRRVGLANLLVGDWDVLILDEPTNHLDVEGVTWLAQHLRRRWSANQGGLLVVTHDRWFLDEVCTATWEVHDRIVEPFEGGYAAYVLQRVERDRQAALAEQKRQNLLRKELAWLRRGAPARTSKPRFRIDAANQLIEDVPPIRDSVELARLATSRLGKDVVDILDVSVSYPVAPDAGAASDEPAGLREVLHDVTWRIAPGERTGVLGVNGAGKSTLLGLVTGAVEPTTGRVKRGKTVKVATLTQELAELKDVARDRVSDVVARKRTTYQVGTGSSARDLTPGQLLERLGFSNAQLSTPVADLSGGQKRRLQLLLILLDEPNVLVLDEPTNDMDTDMLAAIEDLLDSWPGTLLVVSHDRYLLERVTDQQYAVLGGRFRHLPGGVDEYLRLRAADPVGTGAEQASAGAGRGEGVGIGSSLPTKPRPDTDTLPTPSSVGSGAAPAGSGGAPALSGAELHAARKELESLDRRLGRLAKDVDALHVRMAEHDQSDYVWLGERTAELRALEDQVGELEERWLELSELAG